MAEQNLNEKPVKIEISLPTNAYFISGIRDFTLALIKNMTDFSEKWAFRFQSIVDELCNNAIEHGSKPGETIKVFFICNPHKSVEIIVQDTGTGTNKVKADDIKKLLVERRAPGYVHTGIRGRGLSKIVAEWTDELDFTDLPNGGIQARVLKNLNDPKTQEMSGFSDSPTHVILN